MTAFLNPQVHFTLTSISRGREKGTEKDRAAAMNEGLGQIKIKTNKVQPCPSVSYANWVAVDANSLKSNSKRKTPLHSQPHPITNRYLLLSPFD